MKPKPHRVTWPLLFMATLYFFSAWTIARANTIPNPQADQHLVNAGDGSWQWQHPQPQGNNLTTIHCPTENACDAGGFLGHNSIEETNRVLLPVVIAGGTASKSCDEPYLEDFSSPSSGWPTGYTGVTSYNYMAGEYSLLHHYQNAWFAVSRGDHWEDDLLLSVDGYVKTHRGIWGLLFGMQNNWESFYVFEISPSTQTWYMFAYEYPSGWYQISSGASSQIVTGQKNSLLIQGANDRMYFYVNNYLLFEMEEKSGYIGLAGGSYVAGTDLRYDDFLFQKATDCLPLASANSVNTALTEFTFEQNLGTR